MKNTLLFCLLILLAGSAFAQKKDTVTTRPAGKVDPKTKQVAYRDYNFAFLTTPKYDHIAVAHRLDTATQKFLPVQDSAGSNLQFVVSKERGRITITSIDPAQPFAYSEQVRFASVTEDGYFSLVYVSLSESKEVIVINPLFGFAVISFKDCKKPQVINGKNCDLNNHYFGECDTRMLR